MSDPVSGPSGAADAPEVLYSPWRDDRDAVGCLLEAWQGYERDVYAEAVRLEGLDAVAVEEWDAMTHPRSGWATSRAEAEEHTSSLAGRCVVEIRAGDVREALAWWLSGRTRTRR